MSQNNMISFITLTDVNDKRVEINPAFIMMMQRAVHNDIPCTMLTLSFGKEMTVMQTPEEIAELQIATVTEVMKNVMSITAQIVKEMDDPYGY